ncbi:hypothetical protein ACLMJK_002981 [Lecanora helva]
MTEINFYNDHDCHNFSSAMQTDTKAGSGSCILLDEIRSVFPVTVESGCTVTIYSNITNAYCSGPTSAPLGSCTSADKLVTSFSVDCTAINGTLEGYTTVSTAFGSFTSSTIRSSSIIPSSTSSGSQTESSSSSTQIPSPSPASQDPSHGGGLSKNNTIILAVVLPVGCLLFILVILVMWKKTKDKKHRAKDNDAKLQVSQNTNDDQNTEGVSSFEMEPTQVETSNTPNGGSLFSLPAARPPRP